MTLKEYVENKPFFRAKRGLGRESEWLGLCELALTGGVLYVFDPGVLPGQGADIPFAAADSGKKGQQQHNSAASGIDA